MNSYRERMAKARKAQDLIDLKAAKSLTLGGFYQIEARGWAGFLRKIEGGRVTIELPGGQLVEEGAGFIFPTDIKPCFFPRRMLNADGTIKPEALARLQHVEPASAG